MRLKRFSNMAEKILQFFEKLNNKNYIHWCFKMEMVLIQNDCWEAIETEKPTDEKKAEVWQKKDNKAKYFITLCVENNQLTHVKNNKTAKEVWDALKKFHQRSTMCSRTRLIKKLFKAELKKGDNDMEKHLQDLQDWIDELKDLNYEFEEKYVKSIILASLNEDYDMIVTALEARDEDKLSVSEIKAKLLDESERRKQKVASDSTTALKVTRCFKNRAKNNQTNVKCYSCGEMGHYSRDCEKKSTKTESSKSHKAGFVMENNLALHLSNNDVFSGWCIDSGATCHISNDKEAFSSLNLGIQEEIKVANGATIKAIGKGDVKLIVEAEKGVNINVTIYDVLYVPEAKGNLLSVQKLIEKDFKVIFNKDIAILVKGKRRYKIGKLRNGLYMMNEHRMAELNLARQSNRYCIHQWHYKLAHRNLDDIRKMKDKFKIEDCQCKDDCEACIKGKMSREPFPKKSVNPAKQRLDVIVSDMCGPMQVESIGGKRYFVTFIDEYTRYSHVYFLKEKSEMSDHLIQFVEMLKNKFGRKPKIFRSDNGLEYVNSKVQSYLKREGIQIQHTVPYSSQQNGIAERKNRTLMEAARSMLFEAKLCKSHWAEAVLCANYIQNRLITRATNKTPIELWNDEFPKDEKYYEFGADCYAWIPKQKRKKLDQRAQKLKFMGYDETSKGYRLINPETKMITIARDVRFLESREHIPMTNPKCDEGIVSLDLEPNETESEVIDSSNNQLNDANEHDANEFERDVSYNNTTSDIADNESSYYESEGSIYETDHGDEFDEDYIDQTITQNVVDSNINVRRSSRPNIGRTSKFDDFICKAEQATTKSLRPMKIDYLRKKANLIN